MKVCLFTDAWMPVWGGGQTHIWEIANKLVTKYDCTVDIIVPNLIDYKGKHPAAIENYYRGKLRVVRLGPGFVFPNIIGRSLFPFLLVFYLVRSSYEIYHSHSYSTTLFLPLLKILKRSRIVFTLHGLGSTVLGNGLINSIGLGSLLSYLIVNVYKYDALISVAKKSITGEVRTRNYFVVGNGVNIDKFDNIKGLKDKTNFNILWVGRFVPVKGLPVLVEVAAGIIKKYPKVRFKLIGDGGEKERIRKLVTTYGLATSFKLENATFGNSLVKMYKSANVFVLPSIEAEGFPVTIAEAMAAKLPVIASNIGDTDRLVIDGQTGYLVRPGDKEDLYNKINKLLASPDMEKMGKNGYALVRSSYTWDKITQQTYEIYKIALQ